jgi:hypothetical protein
MFVADGSEDADSFYFDGDFGLAFLRALQFGLGLGWLLG